jgi:hypothetical protein
MGPVCKNEKGRGDESADSGGWAKRAFLFYFFSLFFISLLLVYIGIVDIYIYVYVCPF